MSYRYRSIFLSKLSIIGAGQIGPDIALHFLKVFDTRDVRIVLVDIAEQALRNARVKIERKIQKGVETGAFQSDAAERMKAGIIYSLDYKDIAGSQIVLEAATEDERIKEAIFREVERLCDDSCLFCSNSSHMQPEVIFKNVRNQSRCLVTHYFFPAERNPVVEIIHSDASDPQLVRDLLGFYESIGKIPIKVRSSYGYAVDPIFEGLCQTAVLCLERGLGTVKEIDKVAQEALGLGVGPFVALNLTGGNPITDHGLNEMHRLLLPWFQSPETLSNAVKHNLSWETAGKGEEVVVPPEKAARIAAQFRGAFFALASYIIDLGICDISSLDMACEIALVVRAPFSMMNETGLDASLDAVRKFCGEHEGFPVPQSLERAAREGRWDVTHIVKEVVDSVAVLTIRRPKVLNALNSTVMEQLQRSLTEVEQDSSLIGSVLTGFGVKAFVSGADINELAQCKTPADGYDLSRKFHRVLDAIEQLAKPVVCAYNGFAFGGGNELALACTARICRKNMPVVACQPEVNLGFIAGSGGTQRLPRLIGIQNAAEILRTGRPVGSSEAVGIGLVNRETEHDLIDEAVSFVREISSGAVVVPAMTRAPLAPAEIEPVNIRHLSKKIDEILVRAIYEGAKMNLAEGLDLEARSFGECVDTEDMKIGLENYLQNGPKARAQFVHR